MKRGELADHEGGGKGEKRLEHAGWVVEAVPCTPILSSQDLQDLEGRLGLDPCMQLPEILFGNNALSLSKPDSSFRISFDAEGLLREWMGAYSRGEHEVLKVPEAEVWLSKPGMARVKKLNYDWTWSSTYGGEALRGDQGITWSACPAGGIDVDMLKDRSAPILLFEDIGFYEDFLHDAGAVSASVKFRVMPLCWFVLLRYWARVDGVKTRVWDTRFFHKFGDQRIYRETTRSEATYEELRKAGLSAEECIFKTADDALMGLRRVSGRLSVTLHEFMDLEESSSQPSAL
jgi:type 2A phosphatase activator TIP41